MPPRKKIKADHLAPKAEKRIFKKKGALPGAPLAEVKKLIHDLQVYQVELEMKNEELRHSQEEIEASRSKYVDLFDFSPVGYFIFNRQGKILETNLTGAKMLGVERSRLPGRFFSSFVAREDRRIFQTHCDLVLKAQGKHRCELKLAKKGTGPSYASLESIAFSERKNGFRIRSAVIDITERKKAQEEALRLTFELEEKVEERTAQLEAANEELRREIAERKRTEEAVRRKEREFRALFEFSSVGMAQRDPATNRLTRVNRKLCEMTGYSAKELLAKTHADITHPDDREKENREWTRLLQDQTDAWSMEKRYVCKNGEVIWAHVNGRLLRDDSGNPFRTLAVIQDITERKRADEELRRNKEKFELLSDTASKLLASDQPQRVVNELCRRVMAYLDCHTFFNYLVDEEKQRLHLNACAGIPEETAREIEWLNFGVAVCGCAARDGARIIAENIPETPDPRTDLVKSFGIKAYACHPLYIRGKVMGTLSFGTRSRISFTEDELALMKTVADQIALAMERISLLSDVRRHADQLEAKVRERTEELAKANRGLTEQSRILEGFFKSSITPLVFLDRDFNFIRVNEAYARACAREVSEFGGRNHFALYPHEENEAIFRKVAETKTVYKATAQAFSFPDHPEWGVTYWDWVLTPILDSRGDVEFLVFSLNNVTDRVQAEEELWQTSLYARSLLEASLDPLVTISAEGKIMDVNHATEVITGWERDRLIGTDFSEYFTDPAQAQAGYRQVFSKGTVRDYPLAIRHQSGKITNVLYNATVYKDEAGEVQGVFAAARDVTDINKAQEALRDSERQLRSLSAQLISAQEIERKRVARELHDGLQQTLTAIKFKVESFLLQMRRARTKANVQTLEPIVSMIQDSVQEIRKIQANLRPPMLEDLGILACISWVCREFQNMYPAIRLDQNIQIEETDIPLDIKMVIYRILQEGLNNIAKHSEADQASLSLRKIENIIELVIRDNGRGFGAREILSGAKITTGLGLGSMRERTEAAHGVFAIESTEGKGTVIQVSWAL